VNRLSSTAIAAGKTQYVDVQGGA